MRINHVSFGLVLPFLLLPLQAAPQASNSASASESVAQARMQQPENSEGGGQNTDSPSEAATDEESAESEAPVELGERIVTGSRLIGGDPSARVYSFTAEDIAKRGVSNLEELFRKLPWTYSGNTTQTSNSVIVPGGTERTVFTRELGLGISTVNLRGLGSANTLLLMNGRRIAGSGGQEDDFVNLLNVPLSAIERVDIQLGGSSAVYGSDAIGGVVNFITKRNYQGFSATYRHEYSDSDSDRTKANIIGGYSWGSGNVTAVLARSTSKPITNKKTGWTTLDYRDLLGPEFDTRKKTIGQPGVACEVQKRQGPRDWPPQYGCVGAIPFDFFYTYYQLPADHSGVGATIDDFHVFSYDQAPVPLDEIPPQNGIDSTDSSLKLSAEQYINDDLRVYADVFWSLNESYQEHDRAISFPFIIPASNAYNPFGKAMRVFYAPVYESDNGLMPAQYDASENETRSLAFGLIWNFSDLHELQLDINRTKSWREAWALRGWPERGRFDPTAEAFYEALSSPDPERAINVFGNGTAQGSAFDEFLTRARGPWTGVNETRQYNLSLRGQLFNMWGGPAIYSLGGEYRENISFSVGNSTSTSIEEIEGEYDQLLGSQYIVGVARPSRDIQAYYGELALPLFGENNRRTGLHSLILTLQARYDVSEAEGSIGGYSQHVIPVRWYYWDPDTGFDFVVNDRFWRTRTIDPNLVTARDGRLSPRIGFQYQPNAGLTLRAAWRRSFKAPVWSDQFSPRDEGNPSIYASGWRGKVIDPYDPDGPTEITQDLGVTQVFVPSNPEIESEYSDYWSLDFEWAPESLPGLRWSMEWSLVDVSNRVRSSSAWFYNNPEWILNHPHVAVRNERGDLVQVKSIDINIAADYNEIVTGELEYSFDTRFGTFTPRVGYTRYLDDYTQVVDEAPRDENIGTQNGLDEYKWQGSVTWLWGRFAADIYAYYTPGYVNTRALQCNFARFNIPGSRCTRSSGYLTLPVSSLTTVDMTVTYLFDNGLRLRAGGTNILNRAAPITLSFSGSSACCGFSQGLQVPYDPTRWDARGRVFFMELNWEM